MRFTSLQFFCLNMPCLLVFSVALVLLPRVSIIYLFSFLFSISLELLTLLGNTPPHSAVVSVLVQREAAYSLFWEKQITHYRKWSKLKIMSLEAHLWEMQTCNIHTDVIRRCGCSWWPLSRISGVKLNWK